MNLVRVVNDKDLDEIIMKNVDKLILIMIGSKNCPQSTIVKPKFIELAKNEMDSLFVFIDITKYVENDVKYLKDLQGTPKFVFFFNNTNLGCIYGPDHNILNAQFTGLKQKLQIFKRQHQPHTTTATTSTATTLTATQPTQQKEVDNIAQTKQFILTKLGEMQKAGIVLSQNYTIDSDFDQMYNEYKIQVALIEKRLSQQDTLIKENIAEKADLIDKLSGLIKTGSKIEFSSSDSVDKLRMLYATEMTRLNIPTPVSTVAPKKREDKIREIQELDKLNRYIQMQQFAKLQMLQRLQKMKEIEERKEAERVARDDRRRKSD